MRHLYIAKIGSTDRKEGKLVPLGNIDAKLDQLRVKVQFAKEQGV